MDVRDLATISAPLSPTAEVTVVTVTHSVHVTFSPTAVIAIACARCFFSPDCVRGVSGSGIVGTDVRVRYALQVKTNLKSVMRKRC